MSDTLVSVKASEFGLKLTPISDYCINSSQRGGLILGYTAFDEKQIKQGVKKIAAVFAALGFEQR